MKIIFKAIILTITCLIFLYAFSSSYTSQNIDDLDFVIALGIDYSDDQNMLKVSFEFADINSFSEDNSSNDSEPIVDTVEASSISSAINIMNAYEGKQLNLSHCKIIVFSQDIAQSGISSEVNELISNTQIRPTANIIISSATSSDYIENSTSSLEQVLTKYYDIFPTSSLYSGYTSNITLKDFYEDFSSNSYGSVAILGSLNMNADTESDSEVASSGEPTTINETSVESSSQIVSGDRDTENFGLCVLKNGSLIR